MLQLEPCNCPWFELDSTLNRQSNLCFFFKKNGLCKEMMLQFACGYEGSLIANSFLSPSPELADKWENYFFFIIYLSPAFLGCLLGSDHSIYYRVLQYYY